MSKIYLSSTYTDLIDYREAAYRVLRMMRHDVFAMEDYVATDQRPLAKCLDDVAECDLYVGIFGWRYGFVPGAGNPDQRSITELEFRHARRHGKPCLLFLIHEDAPWPRSRMDRSPVIERVDTLREELCRDDLVLFFSTPDDLAKKVAASVAFQEAQASLRAASEARSQPVDEAAAHAALHGAGPIDEEHLIRRVSALWVDDEPDNNIYETIMLSSLGLEVTHTLSTGAARQYRARKHFDLIFTDIARGLDRDAGLDLIKEVRRSGASTPIIVYTTATGGRARKARELGADAVVTTPAELLKAVLELNVLQAAPAD